MATYDYDLITIGGGSGGIRASRLAASLGARVAVIEESRLGGTCVMRGCVPKKLLVIGSHFADGFEDAHGFGWSVGDVAFDWPKLIASKNAELDRLEGVYHRILRENGVDLIEGRGRVADAHTVEEDGAAGAKTLTAERILIAVGGWPATPDIPGIEHVISSNEALDLPELPGRIVIVGGGYIAVEFAGIFNSLGSQVTEIIRGGNILRGFDNDVRDFLAEEMEKRGVKIERDCVVRSIEKTGTGYSVRTRHEEVIEADCVMYATGRAPNTQGLGLAEAGVKLNEKGAVEVDDGFRTAVASIYALGDVTDRVNLTPVALGEGQVLARNLFGGADLKMDYADIPTAVFSQPPIGTVGLTETQAREKFGKVDIYASRFKPMQHTLSGRDARTFMKLIVDPASDRVVGCHMVGDDAPEIAQGLGIALKCGATKAQFDATIGIHPSAAEEFVTMREKLPDHGG